MSEPHFTCPQCGAVSYNPNDILNRYCGRCHVFMPPVKISQNELTAVVDNLRVQYHEAFKRWYSSANFPDVEFFCEVGWLLMHYEITDERRK